MRDDRYLRRDVLFGFSSTITFAHADGPAWTVRGFPGIAVRLHSGDIQKGRGTLWTIRRRNRSVALPTDQREITLVPTNKRLEKQPYIILRCLGFEGAPDSRSCTLVLNASVEAISEDDPSPATRLSNARLGARASIRRQSPPRSTR